MKAFDHRTLFLDVLYTGIEVVDAAKVGSPSKLYPEGKVGYRPSILEQLADHVREKIKSLQPLRLSNWKESVELLGKHIIR